MAAETKIGYALMSKHVPVRASMDFMTGRTSFDAGCTVFIKEGPAFVCMAFQTSLLFKAPQSFPRGWFMRVMTGCTRQNSFLQAVALIQLELGENTIVTGITGLCSVGLE